MYSTMILSVGLALAVLGTPGAEAADCDADAELSAQMASSANAAGRLDDAVRLYRTAAKACNRFEYWISAADILADEPLSAPEYAASPDAQNKASVDTYVAAYNSTDDREKRSQAARGLAAVGLKTGDPINAEKWLANAVEWGGDPAVNRELQKRVDEAKYVLSPREADRGMGKAGSILFSTVSGIKPSEIGGGGGPQDPPEPRVCANDFPLSLNFISGSTQLDARTGGNLATLAGALARNLDASCQILFIGHADARGPDDANQQLSERRARAMRDLVEDREPALRGRIDYEGRGEREPLPIALGMSEEDYWRNRRLQIVVK